MPVLYSSLLIINSICIGIIQEVSIVLFVKLLNPFHLLLTCIACIMHLSELYV